MVDTHFGIWFSVKNEKNRCLGIEIQATTTDGCFRRDLSFCVFEYK